MNVTRKTPSRRIHSFSPVSLILVTMLLLSAAPGLPARASEIDEDLARRVDACVSSLMLDNEIPGAQVAIAENGDITYQRGYGVKNRDTGEPVDAATLFRSGSIQKMMTAAAVLVQKDRGLLDLDERVIRLIPELRFQGRFKANQITIENLLTHTAEIPDLGALQCGTDDDTLSEWVSTLDEVYLYAPAGSFFNYSNAGYSLAGLVAERAAGRPYREVMRGDVWDPAGMHDTFFSASEVMARGNFSFGHSVNEETGQSVIYSPQDYQCWSLAPAGTAFTTAADLTRFATMLMDDGGIALTPESAQDLQATHVSTLLPPSVGYGFGVGTDTFAGVPVRQHDGGLAGWTSHLIWVPSFQTAVAVVGNNDASVTSAGECILKEVTGLARDLPVDQTTDPRTWTKYGGVYGVRLQTGELVPALVKHPRGADHLRIATLDPATGKLAWFDAPQLFLDTFFIDLDGNGAPSMAEIITFIPGSTPGGKGTARIRWMRNRFFVGDRNARIRLLH